MYNALHTYPGETWKAIVETGTLCPATGPHVRDDGKQWARIQLRISPDCRTMHYGGNHWVYDGVNHYPGGDRCVGYHNTKLENLIQPFTPWTGRPIGNGILKDGRICFGVCTHQGNSGVNVYSDGGLETFDGSTDWVQLEVEVCDTTSLRGGRASRYCVRGPAYETCDKVVLKALWVPFHKLPGIVWLS